MTEFDELIFLRRGKKITLNEIAEYIGCTVGLLSKYENGKCNLSEDKKIKYKQYIKNN